MTNGIKRAIQAVKVISATYQHKDVLVVLERGDNALKLIKIMDMAFDGYFPYETVVLETFPRIEDREAKKWLDESKFLCEECGKEYKTERALKIHYTKKHPELEKPKIFAKTSKPVSKKERMDAFKKHLVDNPKKVLILQRDSDSTFIEGQRDIRPLKYLGEDDAL